MTKAKCIYPQRILAAFVLTASIVAFSGVFARSQTAGSATINGAVSDANQAVVPTATVTVIDVDTGVEHVYKTDSAGLYSAPFLLPGHYEVDGTAPNFGKVEEKGITLLVGQTLTIDLTLKVSGTDTTVEVSANNEILDVEKTEVSQVVDSQLISNLPVNARNWSDFVLMTPTVTQDGGSGLISFHGISGLYNQNYVDGANNNQMLFSEARGRASGAPYVYSLDSIKEFSAETANYSVEFGQAAGGQVNAITKSGTNSPHGDLFYYLRYPGWRRIDRGKISNLQRRSSHHQQNQFGGSVGGPIFKDKLFYFFTYDGFRRVGRVLYSDSNSISLTPSGVYSSATNASLVTPNQCPTAANTSYTPPTANPTAYISSAQCASGIGFLMQVANIASGDVPPSRYAKQDLFFPRLDYHINSRNDAFADFNWADFYQTYGYSPATRSRIVRQAPTPPLTIMSAFSLAV